MQPGGCRHVVDHTPAETLNRLRRVEHDAPVGVVLEARVEIIQDGPRRRQQRLLQERLVLRPVPVIQHDGNKLRPLIPRRAPVGCGNVAGVGLGLPSVVAVGVRPEDRHHLREVGALRVVIDLATPFRQRKRALVEREERRHEIEVPRHEHRVVHVARV